MRDQVNSEILPQKFYLRTALFNRNLQLHSIPPKGGNMNYVVAKHACYQFLLDFFSPYFLDKLIHRLFLICQLAFQETYPGFFHCFSLLLDSL